MESTRCLIQPLEALDRKLGTGYGIFTLSCEMEFTETLLKAFEP